MVVDLCVRVCVYMELFDFSRYVVVTKAFVYYILPLFIIGVLYLMMAQRLHVSAREMPGESLSMQSRSQVRARRYVARMVVAFVVGKYGERVSRCPGNSR